MAIFQMTGVLSKEQIAMAYGHYLILLLMGGFIISQAMEKSGTHKRLAFSMIRLFGGKEKNLVFGFIVATALLSMWISNTATTLMLLPIALAVLSESKDSQLRIPLLLGICYGASIGGMGTPIGTPPNIAFIKEYKDATGIEINFLDWMALALPLVGILIPILWLILTRHLKGNAAIGQLPKLGPWKKAEVRTLIVFSLIAMAWVFRKAPFGGWSDAFGCPKITDADIALLSVVVLFLIPSGEGEGKKLLDWPTAVRIPWGILLLFSGGLVIAAGFKESGLSQSLASQLSELIQIHPFLILLIICFSVTFITEFTSNTASTLLLLPILAQTALASDLISDPKLIMIPATISASCAFMLPVATPPNAVIYGSEKLSIYEMAREGFIFNILFAFIISIYFYLVLS